MTVAYFELLDPAGFLIVDKDYYDRYGHCSDQGLSELAQENLPREFYEVAACFYQHDFESYELARQILISIGFEEKKNLVV